MKKSIKFSAVLVLMSTLWGCTANSNNYALSAADAEALRVQTERLEQRDRNINQQERMRKAEAISHATRNVEGGVTYSPTTTTVVVPR